MKSNQYKKAEKSRDRAGQGVHLAVRGPGDCGMAVQSFVLFPSVV